jgi:proteic killer suppression protein
MGFAAGSSAHTTTRVIFLGGAYPVATLSNPAHDSPTPRKRTFDTYRLALYTPRKGFAPFETPKPSGCSTMYSRNRSCPSKNTAQRKLYQLHEVRSLQDLAALPSNRLEALSGDRAGQSSIRVNDRFRVCFSMVERDAFDVEIMDYH